MSLLTKLLVCATINEGTRDGVEEGMMDGVLLNVYEGPDDGIMLGTEEGSLDGVAALIGAERVEASTRLRLHACACVTCPLWAIC